ncbi:MAG: alpha/beta hydrolase [Nocardioides sp.]|nr:alpha/beta hydrolase [Nocardioides sp.]
MLQAAAPISVRYGDDLRTAGLDVLRPARVRVPTRHGDVRCDVYLPHPSEVTAALRPALVHLHGGAFIVRHPRMDDWWARLVAAEVGAVVVNVDYATAPQVRYPVAQEQAADVVAWVLAGSPELAAYGVDPDRVAISGFSAGGNLAASACLQLRDQGLSPPRLQLLGVPSLDVTEDQKPATVSQPMVDARLLRLVRATYFPDVERRAEPYASPLLTPDLTGLAPALVLTAEQDALRAEGDAYAGRLAAAGVPVEHHVVPGRDHYFLDPDLARRRPTLDRMTGALRAALLG